MTHPYVQLFVMTNKLGWCEQIGSNLYQRERVPVEVQKLYISECWLEIFYCAELDTKAYPKLKSNI